MSVYGSMYEEVKNHIEEVGRMELGSEQHVKTVNCANGMVDRLIERDKVRNEERRLDIEERKLELEEARLVSDNRGRLVVNIITGVTTVAYVATHVWTVLSDRKFESGGFMHTSEAGRTSRRNLLSLMDKFRK